MKYTTTRDTRTEKKGGGVAKVSLRSKNFGIVDKETMEFTYGKEAHSLRMSNLETEHSTSFVLV
jgi:hypothetical protein